MINFKLNGARPVSIEDAISCTRQIVEKANMGQPYYRVLARSTIIDPPIERYKNLKNIIFIGVGGSTLSIKTMLQSLVSHATRPVYFCSNMDECQNIASKIGKQPSLFYVASQSGATAETVFMTKYFAGCAPSGSSFIFNIGKADSPLKQIANNITKQKTLNYSADISEYPNDINPRFSIISNQMLLPLALCGINYRQYFAGINQFLQKHNNMPNQDYIEFIASSNAISQNKQIVNIAIGAQKLHHILEWHYRIAAETLARIPNFRPNLNILTSNDAHTLLEAALTNQSQKIYRFYQIQGEANLFRQQYQSIINNTLINSGATCQIITLDYQNDADVGYLISALICSDIAIANMASINPFQQPNIDAIKSQASGFFLDNRSYHTAS